MGKQRNRPVASRVAVEGSSGSGFGVRSASKLVLAVATSGLPFVTWSTGLALPDASPALELALAKISASALAELLELVARMLHSRGHAADLFPAQWVALRYFAKSGPAHRTASDLARFQGLANGPVSRTVRTLIHKGLLAKSAEQPRGRAEALELTEAGRTLLEQDPTLEIETALAALDPADQVALARGLETVLRRVSSDQA